MELQQFLGFRLRRSYQVEDVSNFIHIHGNALKLYGLNTFWSLGFSRKSNLVIENFF